VVRPRGRKATTAGIAGFFLLWTCASAHAAHLDVSLAQPSLRSPLPPVELTLRSTLPGKEPRKITVSGAGPHRLPAEEGTWSLEAKAAGRWAQSQKIVLAAQDSRTLQIDLFEASAIQGRIEVDKGEQPPGEIGVDLHPPANEASLDNPRPKRSPNAKPLILRCPVRDGAFNCPAPAGTWDLRIGAADRIAHYFWKVPFSKEQPAVLKPIRLRKGASVVGWARADGRVKEGTPLQVRLTPLQAASSQSAETTDRVLALSAQADARGFFQISGVSPGSYVLTATLEGFGPARFFPLRVFEDRESKLEEPLILRPPITLEARVSPPVDVQGRPWHLEIFDLGTTPGAMDSRAKGSAGAEGLWQSPPLSAGHVRLQLSDRDQTIWHVQEVELSETLSRVDVDLDLVEIDGEVTIGGEPVEATLHFGGRMGVPSLQFASDENGRFSGYLPREGRWRVDTQAREPLVRRALPNVEVRRASGQNVARVSIDLPAGKLLGRTVDEQGKGVGGASVLVEIAGEPPVFLETDERGEFAAHGLGKGQVFVEARTRELQAEGLWVALDPKMEGPPLELVLRKTREFHGWVLGPAGGVPGAQVIATTPAGNQGQAVTDLAGRFSLKAPAGTTAFDMIVLPPGYALEARRVQVEEGGELRLFVKPEGGTLILEGLDEPEAGGTSAVLLYHEGVPIYALSTLRRWAEGHGRRWLGSAPREAPQLDPGDYQVCRVPAGQMNAVRRPASLGGCVAGHLLPGGELTLRVPRGQSGR
jgi:hypothetical protein